MKQLEGLHCWEIVALSSPLLTIHRAPWARAVEHAEREAGRLPGVGNVVKVRRVGHCVCRMTASGCQPAAGAIQKIVAKGTGD